MSFIHLILDWYAISKRDLPWRANKDVYSVWLSEVILQQTRVNQGLNYFKVFKVQYPNVHKLAQASEQEILNLWQGLGYYSRARNLHKAAKMVSNELDGEFPKSYEGLKKLPGVGPYTAAAIASICYDEKVPAIDGNAYRVYSRLFALNKDISGSNAPKFFFEFAKDLMPNKNTGDFNEAIMELGATICLPKKPLCQQCPVKTECSAFQTGTVENYPVKSKKVKVRKRYFHYFFIHNDQNEFIIKQRTEKDVWFNLNDFPLVETAAFKLTKLPFEISDYKMVADYRHILTHQHLYIKLYEVHVSVHKLKVIAEEVGGEIVHAKQIKDIPFPKPVFSFLHERYPNYIAQDV